MRHHTSGSAGRRDQLAEDGGEAPQQHAEVDLQAGLVDGLHGGIRVRAEARHSSARRTRLLGGRCALPGRWRLFDGRVFGRAFILPELRNCCSTARQVLSGSLSWLGDDQRQQRGGRGGDHAQRDGAAAAQQQRAGLHADIRVLQRALDVQRRAQREDAQALGVRLHVQVELLGGHVDRAVDVDHRIVGVEHEQAHVEQAVGRGHVGRGAIDLHRLVAEQLADDDVADVEARRFPAASC